jgi:hypothetical protein
MGQVLENEADGKRRRCWETKNNLLTTQHDLSKKTPAKKGTGKKSRNKLKKIPTRTYDNGLSQEQNNHAPDLPQ